VERVRNSASQGSAQTIAVAAVAFGWGSAGKLAAILGAVRGHNTQISIVGLDSRLGRPVLAGQRIGAWIESDEMSDKELSKCLRELGVRLAIVVLDPEIAVRLESLGIQVVYVDSLPFLWTGLEPIPNLVSRYCAQLCTSLPQPSWKVMRKIQSLIWVGAIVELNRTSIEETRRGKAVINLGGLHSPLSEDGNDNYLKLVMGPILKLAMQRGFEELVVTGNLDVGQLTLAYPSLNEIVVRGGRMTREEFVAEMRGAEVVFTSPGRTVLLELATLRQRAVILPPQNLSQMMNAADASENVDPRIVVHWPSEMLDTAELRQHQALGELEGVKFIYKMIARAAIAPKDLHAKLYDQFSYCLDRVLQSDIRMTPMTSMIGEDGAADVAQVVIDLMQEVYP